jgi:tetratricopeptide (TPR) repeat protein
MRLKPAMLNKINISPREQVLIVYIVLTVVTFAVFWQVNQFDFVNFDDNIYVTENSHVQSGITSDGFHWAFSTRYFKLWHPLVWLSFMLDYQLIGLNAGGYHITNLLLHIMSTLLLFWLFYRMTGAIWKSAFVAAFFALHPLHVESVAWIAERKDVLSAFFWMLTLCLYVYYTEKPVIKRYLLVLLGFVCALMSKPMVVTLPVIMILLDYWPLKRFQLKETGNNLKEVTPGKGPLWLFWEKIPFFILSAVIVIITLYGPSEPHRKYFSLGSRLANAPVSFVTYLEKTFWPHDLAAFYPFSFQLPSWQVLGAVLLIIVISAAVIVSVKRLPYLFVGWLWYAITLLPVIGIIQIWLYAIADRYHYLPSIGIAVMLAWGIPHLFPREDIRTKILFPMGVVFIAILSFITWHQCGYWKNAITLFSHALQVTRDNYVAQSNLASALLGKGKIKEAIDHFNKAISITANYAGDYQGRGGAYDKLNQHKRAIEDYSKAIRLQPELFLAYYSRGISYNELGHYQLAIEDFNKAILLKPDYADAFNNRGSNYFKLGLYQRAFEDFNKAILLKPDYADAYNNRGSAYFKLGHYKLAIEDINKAICLKPDYADAYNNLAIFYLNQDNKELGCFYARKGCALEVCKILDTLKGKGFCH